MAYQQRLKMLDGFRALAILAVMLFHFFSRWIFTAGSSLYPYGGAFNYFRFGYVGVQFFFMISGFVIFFTLERTESPGSFWMRRMIRLVPTMVVASLVTLLVFNLFETRGLFPASASFANLLPSVTFLPPGLFNTLFPSAAKFDYINGSYWSLWPEIQFYFLASTLYYFDRKRFLRNFSGCALILIGIYWGVDHARTGSVLHLPVAPEKADLLYRWITQYFNLPQYLVYFSLGIFFYTVYKSRLAGEKLSWKVIVGLVVFILIFMDFGVRWQKYLLYAGMLLLFFGLIYFPRFLAWFEKPLFTQIGIASYAIYLFHENIGVLLINSLAGSSRFAFIVPLLFIAVICFLCILYTHTLEKRLTDGFKKLLAGKKYEHKKAAGIHLHARV